MTDQVYKGWNAVILKDGATIGFAEAASVEIATGVEPYYEIGSRTPSTIVPGNQEVAGSISRAWVNINYLALVSGTGTLTHFTLCFKAKAVANAPWVYCYQCLFERGAIDVPQDGFLTEDYDFRATSVAVVDGS